jgi:hypothetical protein
MMIYWRIYQEASNAAFSLTVLQVRSHFLEDMKIIAYYFWNTVLGVLFLL